MKTKRTRREQIECLAKDGAFLSVSIVLTPAYEFLTPRQHRLIRRINKAAKVVFAKEGA